MIVMIIYTSVTEISREFKSVYMGMFWNGDLFITFIASTNFLIGRMAGE